MLAAAPAHPTLAPALSLLPASNFAPPPALRALGLALLLGAAAAMAFAVHFALARKETLVFSLAAAALILAAGAAALHWPRLLDTLNRPLGKQFTVGGTIVGGAWLFLLAASALTYTSSGWDECAYLLSGLALRGEPTPYAAGRAPVTHFIAAAFAEAPRFAAPVLGLVLVLLLGAWSVRRWGWAAGALPLALLATQNVFLESFVGLVSELPAAVLLFAAFFLLAREHFVAAGITFALTGLARWNLAVIPIAVTVCIALRFGWPRALRFAVGGAVVVAIFFGLSFAFVEHPMRAIIDGNMQPAIAWAPEGELPPTLLSRARFYFSHAFFLTPPAMFAIVALLANWRRHPRADPADWCVRVALPAGLATYALTMLNIGGHFPRFFAPVLPCAIVVLVEYLFGSVARWHMSSHVRRGWIIALACLTAAWGLWPATAISFAKTKAKHRAVFTDSFVQAVRQHVPHNAPLCSPALDPLREANGLPAMVELRRTLVFLDATRGPNGDLRPVANPADAVRALLRTAPHESFLIIPAEFQPLVPPGAIVAADAHWLLCRSSKS